MFRTMIVSSTVWPFFFPDASGEICKEKKILYKLISGLHSSISIHIASDYLLDETTNWVQTFPSFPSRFYLHILPLFPYFILCCEEPLDRKQSKYTWEHAWILVLNQLYWNRNHLALKKVPNQFASLSVGQKSGASVWSSFAVSWSCWELVFHFPLCSSSCDKSKLFRYFVPDL